MTVRKPAQAAPRQTTEAHEPRRMLNETQVREIVPVSQATLWRMEKDGLFPRGTFISANRKVWFADEIIAWQASVDGRRRGKHHYPKGARKSEDEHADQ
ncbi:helix-turn-helix transcriptional regulator [Bradyrhizobium septentrionale]|uniref:AlpA family phage regulatory protein n=1 Tax=Bradyrhizobium septentrionale TaxID=1404411 RepID=A0A973W5N5_9BRAD|nr:AlpA family phage regulatory protein [Bradyrhizobium septentrionale]UGY16714.1 AlpA family phage regulatory protein [Bradyrhizobium septentrionale]UGY25372.1 AlpA family phage regulatory protein [Bradyrhizobium septentrionale]